jgi:hypothetical protein
MAVDSGLAVIEWYWALTIFRSLGCHADSLAAWLAGKIGARRLLLIKHVELTRGTMRAKDLAARDIVTSLRFPTASGATAFILGPSDHVAVASSLLGEPVGIRIIA